jgi:DNA-binding transcriptional regulator YiaG
MANFASQLKGEIARIAKKAGKAETESLKAASSRYRSDIAALKKKVAELERAIKKLSSAARSAGQEKPAPDGAQENLRFRADGFITLRKKLGLSAGDMGKLLGVSGQSVYKWEQGRAKPQAKQLKTIATARTMGKKQVQAILEAS